uniref:Uncharacterized protein n=1 Tax=Scleropages formosus TaxID=113540 RepID=A0A8C9VMU1_SCLFO
MAPKKKQRVVFPQSQLGTGRQHLNEKYLTLPSRSYELKKDIFCSFTFLKLQVVQQKQRQLKTNFLSEGFSFKRSLIADVNKLVTGTLKKFRQLTDPGQYAKFSAICEEPFYLFQSMDPESPVPQDPVPSTSHQELTVAQADSATMTSSPQSSLHSQPGTSASARSHRSDPLTLQKVQMKRRLDFLSATKRELKKRQQEQVRKLKGKLKTPARITNQTIKRLLATLDRKNKEIRNPLYNGKRKSISGSGQAPRRSS